MKIKSVEKKLEKIPIAEIKINKKNWRKHGRKQRQVLSAALEEVGYVTPVIVNRRTMTLVDGELRYTEMKAVGEEVIDAVMIDVDEETQEKMLALLDQVTNRTDSDKDRYRELVENIVFGSETLEAELKAIEEKVKSYEHTEFELAPEMLKEYNYCILVFKEPVNWMAAKEEFCIDYKIDPINGSKGVSLAVDGDRYIEGLKA